ncbi:hypothetical protein F511_00723 [Dorcoceras hygrometricum]|nr:hypothetical protein F511_00723 [Dorcoceras hygrometricum]
MPPKRREQTDKNKEDDNMPELEELQAADDNQRRISVQGMVDRIEGQSHGQPVAKRPAVPHGHTPDKDVADLEEASKVMAEGIMVYVKAVHSKEEKQTAAAAIHKLSVQQMLEKLEELGHEAFGTEIIHEEDDNEEGRLQLDDLVMTPTQIEDGAHEVQDPVEEVKLGSPDQLKGVLEKSPTSILGNEKEANTWPRNPTTPPTASSTNSQNIKIPHYTNTSKPQQSSIKPPTKAKMHRSVCGDGVSLKCNANRWLLGKGDGTPVQSKSYRRHIERAEVPVVG